MSWDGALPLNRKHNMIMIKLLNFSLNRPLDKSLNIEILSVCGGSNCNLAFVMLVLEQRLFLAVWSVMFSAVDDDNLSPGFNRHLLLLFWCSFAQYVPPSLLSPAVDTWEFLFQQIFSTLSILKHFTDKKNPD